MPRPCVNLNMLRWIIHLMITSMIFFPEKDFFETPEEYKFAYENAAITAEDGAKLHGWYFAAAGAERGTVLFFHGNAGNISHRLYKAGGWMENGFSLLMLDYRGYGQSQGQIKTGDDIVRDGRAAWDWLVKEKKKDPARIVVYGESLGTHPALYLGAENAPAAVILEAPFTSFVELGKLHYALMPGVEFLLRDFQFDNRRLIGRLRRPLLILHGTRDEICPYAMAEELFRLAPGPKELLSVPNGSHNDLPMSAGEKYWGKLLEFTSAHLA